MAVTLLLDDSLATSPLVAPFAEGWAPSSADVIVERIAGLTADRVGPEDAALLASGEVARLQGTHRIAPDVAIVLEEVGPVAMRCPVRPDEIETTPIRLLETSSFGGYLARATVQPFYGIRPARWTDQDDPTAQVVIVEGAEALRPPEAGFSEDLTRAWFILTGEPVVAAVCLVPRTADREAITSMLGMLDEARTIGHERRRDLRRAVASRYDVAPERVTALFSRARASLDSSDRRALLMLLQRGHPGGTTPFVRSLDYLGPASVDLPDQSGRTVD